MVKIKKFLIDTLGLKTYNGDLTWESFVPQRFWDSTEYRLGHYIYITVSNFNESHYITQNFQYLLTKIKETFLDLPGTVSNNKRLISKALSSNKPIRSLIKMYLRKLNYEYRLLTDAPYREKLREATEQKLRKEQIKIQSDLAFQKKLDCFDLVYDVYKKEQPIKYFIHKSYIQLIEFLSKKTYWKLTLFILFYLCLEIYTENMLTTYYECKIAYAENKMPKLKYLGSAGRKIKTLIGLNIGEVQIGVANRQLIDLYSPMKPRIFIPNPNIGYSRKDIPRIKVNLKSINDIFSKKKYVRNN